MPSSYSRSQVLLHWAVVLLILAQYLFPGGMEAAWHTFRDTGTAETTAGALVHIVPGVLILVLALWRLTLRLTHGTPPAPEGQAPWLDVVAGVTHWLIYILLILIPLSGLAAWVFGLGAAVQAHLLMKTVLLWTVGLHVAAALFHQFVLRDNLMARMRP